MKSVAKCGWLHKINVSYSSRVISSIVLTDALFQFYCLCLVTTVFVVNKYINATKIRYHFKPNVYRENKSDKLNNPVTYVMPKTFSHRKFKKKVKFNCLVRFGIRSVTKISDDKIIWMAYWLEMLNFAISVSAIYRDFFVKVTIL